MAGSVALGRDVDAPSLPARGRARRRVRAVLMLGGIAVVALGAGYAWLHGGRVVSIDNAYTNADKVALSTDVSGNVQEIAVHEGQVVHTGDVLFRLDPRQTQIAVEAAEADLAETKLTLEAMKKDYSRMQSDIGAKSAQTQGDQAVFDRYNQLVGRGDLSRSSYDEARYKLAVNRAVLQSSMVAAEVQLAKLGGNAEVDVATLPAAKQAQSRLDEAKRRADATVVRAPFDGVVTRVASLQPGMFLPAGTSAFGLISTDHVWVDANPKETELSWVKPGQPVTVRVDTYPGLSWTGTVESIAPGSGSEFSIIPTQNSSGNWVKVVQRIPLRVKLERKPGAPPLRSGMSVEVEIDTGHERTLHDLF